MAMTHKSATNDGARGRKQKAVDPHKLKIGRVIKKAREAAGWTQAELAKQIGVTAGAIGQWEIGYSSLGRSTLMAVSKALDLPLEGLLDGPSKEAGVPSGVKGHLNLDQVLIDEARQSGVEVEAELGRHLRNLVADARAKQWLKENREALADANAFLARYGLWSDGKRQF